MTVGARRPPTTIPIHDAIWDFPISRDFRASPTWRNLARHAPGRDDPVGVGGVGGSGTRVLSAVLEAAGLDAGAVYDRSRDSFVWPKFKDTREAATSEHSMVERSFENLERFARRRDAQLEAREDGAWRWFWKVPTSFMWLDYLSEYFPRMRYIHVIRHGLDMAFTSNVRQVRVWGRTFGVEVSRPPSPTEVLDYWITANRYAEAKARRLLGDRFLLLSYDELCFAPEATIRHLLEFIGPVPTGVSVSDLTPLIRPSGRMGTYRERDCLALFGADRLQAVEAFGFLID